MSAAYTVSLSHGQGMIEETRILLELWQAGMDVPTLFQVALASGHFPSMSAQRLHNIVRLVFVPRYLVNGDNRAERLQQLQPRLSTRDFEQLLFIYTAEANPILADFVVQLYWPAYAAGRNQISNQEAREFVMRANQEGKTSEPWPASTVQRVAGNLTGCCADFGLLERGAKSIRTILPYRLLPNVAALRAFELHEQGLGDNQIVHHSSWALFGLEAQDVIDDFKRVALRGLLIIQSAGNAVTLGWPYSTWKEFSDALAGS